MHRNQHRLRRLQTSPVLALVATVKLRSDSRWRTEGMANVYVEPRPKGRPEGSPIEDYVVEDRADHPLATFGTQHEAIEWAKAQGTLPWVARVRHRTTRTSPITGGQHRRRRPR